MYVGDIVVAEVEGAVVDGGHDTVDGANVGDTAGVEALEGTVEGASEDEVEGSTDGVSEGTFDGT